jgi:hypothetical protein
LRDLAKPVGVARYKTRLVEALPDSFKGELPTIEQIQAELADSKKPSVAAATSREAAKSPEKRTRRRSKCET